jgi:hypothetical protein
MKAAVQNPVPLSNQSLLRNSYTLTLFLSLGGLGTACAIIKGCSSPSRSLAEQFKISGAISKCCWSESC